VITNNCKSSFSFSSLAVSPEEGKGEGELGGE
jgi:hypothetical protein